MIRIKRSCSILKNFFHLTAEMVPFSVHNVTPDFVTLLHIIDGIEASIRRNVRPVAAKLLQSDDNIISVPWNGHLSTAPNDRQPIWIDCWLVHLVDHVVHFEASSVSSIIQ